MFLFFVMFYFILYYFNTKKEVFWSRKVRAKRYLVLKLKNIIINQRLLSNSYEKQAYFGPEKQYSSCQ